MSEVLFRPGRGSVIAEYRALMMERGYGAEGAFPGDWVSFSAVAPSNLGDGTNSAGSGILEGQTLIDLNDFVYCRSTDSNYNHSVGFQLGVCKGSHVNGPGDITNVGDAEHVAHHTVAIIQTRGVNPGAWVTTTTAGYELTMSTSAGRVVGSSPMGTSADFDNFMGVALTDNSTFTRDGNVNRQQCVALIRCNL